MKLVNQLKELQNEGVISPQVATDIHQYYIEKGGATEKRQTVIFSVIGSLLVGLGLILVFAHNWDELSKITKTIVAISPLLISQVIAIFILTGKSDSLAGREGIGSLIFLCIGLSISLVGQIYNLHGDFGEFLKVWMLLALPMIYLLRSSMVGFLVLGLSTWYMVETHFSESYESTITYWLTVLTILPFFIHKFKYDPGSNYNNIATWIVPIALNFGVFSFESKHEEVLLLVYLGLYSIYMWIGNGKAMENRSLARNGFKVIGSLGLLSLLFSLSFEDVVEELIRISTPSYSLEWLGLVGVVVLQAIIMLREKQLFKAEKLNPIMFVFPIVLGLSLIINNPAVAVFIINGLILFLGVFKVILGLKEQSIGRLNMGLLMIGVLVLCRFFDRDMSFIFRGFIFLVLGAGFLLSNLWILKNRKDEKN